MAKKGFPLIGLAYLGFISIGLPDGLLGIAQPHEEAQYPPQPRRISVEVRNVVGAWPHGIFTDPRDLAGLSH